MTQLRTIRILLVEDDNEDAAIFGRHASHVKWHSAIVVRAKDAVEAHGLLSDTQFDLVCVDLNLGGKGSGLDFLEQAQADAACPPVVIVTGSGDEEKAAETMRSGAYDYVVKDSLSPELLDRTIRTVREKYVLQQERERMVLKLAELSITDELTSVANRRHLTVKLTDEILRSSRTGHIFALLMVDLDNLKEINDRYGHQVGDRVLRSCAIALRDSLRATDFVARYGGDEFCVLLPNASLAGAERAAEKIRSTIESLPDPISTVSVGVALWQPRASWDALLRWADEALYEAKEGGRNRVVVGNQTPTLAAP